MRKGLVHKGLRILMIGVLTVLIGATCAAAEMVEADSVVPTQADVVVASDAAAFLNAIQSNRTIELLPGDYNLSSVDIESIVAEHEENLYFDADSPAGITILGVSNLTILAKEPQEIYSESVFDTVLFFESCDNLNLSGITFGHHNEAFEICTAGVLAVYDSENISLSGCDLYGCGALGITLNNCDTVTISNCIIRDCSQSAAAIYHSTDVQITDTEIFGVGVKEGYPLGLMNIVSDGNGTVLLTRCNIHDNGCADDIYGASMFLVDSPDILTMEDCTMVNNEYSGDITITD